MKDVGEPCAGEPHARFDVAAGGNQASRQRRAARRLPPTLQSSERSSWHLLGHGSGSAAVLAAGTSQAIGKRLSR
ncbi:MAG: hypothetical protein WAN22_27835, partial [Solirubrobacteraceae bacterium]